MFVFRVPWDGERGIGSPFKTADAVSKLLYC
jgi:hypothetical protein